MAQVTVTVNGRTYRLGCDDGQERHLLALADYVNRHVERLKESFGQIGDTRLLLMASIMISDEMVELRRRADALEAEMQRMRQAREVVAERLLEAQESVARTLNMAADRIEAMAARAGAAVDAG
jgi:cell division protein ZapA